MEEWRNFRDSKYEISSLGRVRNKETKKVLKQHYKNNGRKENDYLRIGLYICGKKKMSVSVHRMVAEAFIPNPENKQEINHINNKRDDNRVENLEWCSSQENTNWAYQTNQKGLSQKIPIKLIDKEDNEYIFDSKYKAAQFIKGKIKCRSSIEQICKNISTSLKTGYLVFGFRVAKM